MSSPRRTSLLAGLLLGLLAAPGSGQIVRGHLLDRSAGAPVGGAVVTLVDSAGTDVARVLSRASGWYAMTAPGPGRYRLRAARIGYEDAVTTPFELVAGQALERDLAVTVRAIRLEGLTVKARSRCELRREQGVETQALWSAVRTALTATELTKLERRLHYDVRQYSEDLDPRTLEPLASTTSTVRSGLAEHPFVSAPVDDLMKRGFVRRGATQTSYFAPDAQVLLSDTFLQGHCFQIVLPARSDSGDVGRVGLAFRPLGHRDVPDVRGTLWVDATTQELRTLEYHYTVLDVPDANELGGRVEFTRLATGLWIVSRWYVRMPVALAVGPGRRMTDPTPVQMRPHLARIREQGGVVIAARDAAGSRLYVSKDPMGRRVAASAVARSGTEASEPAAVPGRDVPSTRPGFVRGRVVDAATGDPLPNIEVMLSVGADSADPWTGAMSEPDGTFSFARVAPGNHRLRTRSVGFVDGAWDVQVGPNGLSTRLELQAQPVVLEGLDVVAHARAVRGGFYARQARKMGSFVDREEIVRLSPKRSTDLVRLVPGLRVICPGVSIRCVLRTSSSAPALAGPDAGDCPMEYFVDGILMSNFELDDLLSDEIEGIEVYTRSADVPPRFNIGVSSRCGVMVIWTRGG